MDIVKETDTVLLLGDAAAQETLNQIPAAKKVCFDSINAFLSENESQWVSKFDVALSYLCNDSRITSSEVLSKLLIIMKPQARFIFHNTSSALETCVSDLKICGFMNVSHKEIQNKENKSVIEFHCEKPNFEVGSSVKLSLPTGKSKVSAVWKLDDSDEEVINDEDLLDLDDLKKPDPNSLRVCGTTGKRKACKDCSCGLAEELKAEATGTTIENPIPIQKSSCGSCYLGDAFRCASCPYLGMPAFKPGEKVKLSDVQLKADI